MLDNASKLCVKIEVFKAEMDFEKMRVHSQLSLAIKSIISFYRRKNICNSYLKKKSNKK